MNPTVMTLCIILAGIFVVIGGVLFLRLHAFLALILGALLVAAITPAETVQQSSLDDSRFDIQEIADDQLTVQLGRGQWLEPGMRCDLLRNENGFREIATLQVESVEKTAHASIARLTFRAPPEAEPQPGDYIVTPAARRAALKTAATTIGERVAEGFGSTCANIGILIAMASIIGKCLLDSGGADRIVRSMLKWLGEKGAPLSFLFSGFLLGIPVFFDTVFYLMIPLGKAMRMRTGRNYLLYVLTIIAGATMTHSLVPPTPGPLLVAEQLNVDMGLMILVGSLVGAITAGFGYFYAVFVNRIWELPLRETPDVSLEELERISRRDESELPPLWLSLLPILLPVVFIGGYTLLELISGIPTPVMRVAETLGDKNLALVISAGFALYLIIRQKTTNLKTLSDALGSALESGGVIILITAGGGAFGKVLQQTGVAGLVQQLPSDSPALILILAFLITAGIRIAQGSATVAMITTVGILSGISDPQLLGFHPVYLALAIGCGSKPGAWMNDSGFWVITKMSGMSELEGLKYITPMTSSMGIVGLLVLLLAVRVFPLV